MSFFNIINILSLLPHYNTIVNSTFFHLTSIFLIYSDLVHIYGGVDGRTIIFCQTKKECNELALDAQVSRAGGGTKELHGDIPQGQREKTMQAFRDGKVRALIATDVAARGLDVKGKYFKRRSEHREWKHCSCHGLLSLKHPNKSFLTQ